MHELALVESVLEIIQDAARTDGFRQVRRVILCVGRLSGAEAEALHACFEAVVAGSVAQDAVLEIRDIPGTGWCARCALEVPLAARYDPCPRCGAVPLRVIAGTDLRVEALDVL